MHSSLHYDQIADFNSIASHILVAEFFFDELASLILFYPIYMFYVRINVIRKMRVKPRQLKNRLKQTEARKLKINSTLVFVSKRKKIRTSKKSLSLKSFVCHRNAKLKPCNRG